MGFTIASCDIPDWEGMEVEEAYCCLDTNMPYSVMRTPAKTVSTVTYVDAVVNDQVYNSETKQYETKQVIRPMPTASNTTIQSTTYIVRATFQVFKSKEERTEGKRPFNSFPVTLSDVDGSTLVNVIPLVYAQAKTHFPGKTITDD